MLPQVAVVVCTSYDDREVMDALLEGVGLLGGIETFCRNGDKILLKPNLLAGDRPEKAVTTHPSVFKAVGKIFKDAGGRVQYGDSPGIGNPERAFKHSGLKNAADELGIEAADFTTSIKISYPEAFLAKQLYLARGTLDTGLVSISKMKTHGFTRITGAVKNQFGCIPGLRKGEYHVKMPDIYQFSRVLLDINRYLRPRLCIMDGITAMEGNGPRGGEPVPMQVILLSRDPVALDIVFCKLIALNPDHVPYLKIARELDPGKYDDGRMEVLGAGLSGLINKNFKVVRKPPVQLPSRWYFFPFLKRFLSPKPHIDIKKCTNCGSCVKQCPVRPRAVNWFGRKKHGKPEYNYTGCIRCFCCQEVCPEKAITIKSRLLSRLLFR